MRLQFKEMETMMVKEKDKEVKEVKEVKEDSIPLLELSLSLMPTNKL